MARRDEMRRSIGEWIQRYRAEGGVPGRLVLNPRTLSEVGPEPIEGLTPEPDDECPPDHGYVLPADDWRGAVAVKGCVLEEAYYNPQVGAEPARAILCVANDGRAWVSEADGRATDLDVTADEGRQMLANWRQGGRGS